MNTFALVLFLLLLLAIVIIVFLVRAYRKKGSSAEVIGLQGKLKDKERKYKELERKYIDIINKRELLESEGKKAFNSDIGKSVAADLQ